MEIKGYMSPGVLRRLVNFSLHLEMVLLCLDLLGNDIFDYFFLMSIKKAVTAWSCFSRFIYHHFLKNHYIALCYSELQFAK